MGERVRGAALSQATTRADAPRDAQAAEGRHASRPQRPGAAFKWRDRREPAVRGLFGEELQRAAARGDQVGGGAYAPVVRTRGYVSFYFRTCN